MESMQHLHVTSAMSNAKKVVHHLFVINVMSKEPLIGLRCATEPIAGGTPHQEQITQPQAPLNHGRYPKDDTKNNIRMLAAPLPPTVAQRHRLGSWRSSFEPGNFFTGGTFNSKYGGKT